MFCYCGCVAAKNEATQLEEEAAMPIEELLERYGGAGLLLNRTLARMKKDHKILSPVTRAKSSSQPPEDGSESSASPSQEPDTATDRSSSEPVVPEKDNVCVNLADSISNGICEGDRDGEAEASAEAAAKTDSTSLPDAIDGAQSSSQENGATTTDGCSSSTVECSGKDEVHSSVAESGFHSSAECSNEAGSSCIDSEPGPSSSTSEVHCCGVLCVVLPPPNHNPTLTGSRLPSKCCGPCVTFP